MTSNLRTMLPLGITAIALVANVSPVFAGSKPPVRVEVVIDADEDFFGEEEAKPKGEAKDGKEGVRERADKLFDELDETSERVVKSGKKKKRGDNQNINTQVVNVVVMGDKDVETKAEAKGTAEAKPPVTPPVMKVPVSPAPPKSAAPSMEASHEEKFVSWWDRPSHAQAGDMMLWVQGLPNGTGGAGGLGFEGMASDLIGIRLTGSFGSFGSGDLRHGERGPQGVFDFTEGGIWANPNDIPSDLERGHVHLVDLSLALHILEKSQFDLFPSIGVSHFGYVFESQDKTEIGGAGYLRLGVGFNLYWGRLFAGGEFGWYPVEVFRYTVDQEAWEEYDRFGYSRRDTMDFDAIDDPFDERRFTVSAHFGIRL